MTPSLSEIKDVLDAAADFIKDRHGGDPAEQTGWKSDEALDVWQRLRASRDLIKEHARANAEHERAEGLTKEVERLKAKYEPGHTDLMVSPEAIDEALAAEAKLVAYEEPVGDWIAASCTELHERGFHREANELRRLSAVLTLAVSDVLAERKRQVTDKGYDAAHDDAHKGGEIIYDRHWGVLARLTEYAGPLLASSPYRTALVDAGAMILAEIERLDRAALSGEEGA